MLNAFFKQILVSIIILFTTISCSLSPYAVENVTLNTANVLDSLHAQTPPSPVYARTPDAIVLCRSHQCSNAAAANNREFIFNALWHFFDQNVYSSVLLCEADEIHRRCYENFISYPVHAGITPGNVFTDSANLADVRLLKAEQKIELVLNYNYHFNGVVPNCKPSRLVVSVNSPNQIIMEDLGHECRLTTIGGSIISTVYGIDFIDLDYGLIGMHYSIGASGTAHGGKIGYMLMRFLKTGRPRNNTLKNADAVETIQTKPNEPPKTAQETIPEGHYTYSPIPLSQ